jgi:NAD(P)-dependent dehydrogenase (short-subunit alcohol dehydrogenase family)
MSIWENAMRGKICLVTGTTSGIGAATAKELAARGATVLGVARGRTEIPGVEPLVADLADLGSVRTLAAGVREYVDRIDVLVNNAGVSKFRHELTADGYERTFATNHLGPFLLTNLLAEPLTTAHGHVVTVSSELHRRVREIDWAGLATGRPFEPLRAYGVSKLLNLLCTTELARRAEPHGVRANGVSPGFTRTRLGREAIGGFGFFLEATRIFQANPARAATGLADLAGLPDPPTGRYFTTAKGKARERQASALAGDPAVAARLWTLSAELAGLPTGTGW